MSPHLRLLMLTLVRIPVALAFLVWILSIEYSTFSLIIALILLITIELSDFLDGFIARRSNLVSELGSTLDPYADSVARLIVYSALAFDNLALMAVPLVMAFRDVTVAYTRILMTRAGISASANWSGKIKAVVQGVCAFLLILSPVLWPVHEKNVFETFLFADMFEPTAVEIISLVVIIVTLLSMIEYIVRAMPAVRSGLYK